MHRRIGAEGSISSAAGPASGSGEDGDSAELPLDFLADLDAWFASSDGAMLAPLPITPPLGAVDDSDAATVCGSSAQVETMASATLQAPPQPRERRTLIKPKSSTQRQKEELQYLRGKAAELETQLRTLKRSREPNETCAAAVDSANDSCNAWKDVAKRQRMERSKVEEENAKLIGMLRGQIKLARGMERLLGKREVWDQLQEGQWRKSDLEGQADDQVFARLQQNVDARYPVLGAVFRSSGLDGVTEDLNDTKLTHTPADGMVFECRHVKLVPFDSRTVEDVVWRSFREGRVKLANDHIIVMKESPDVVLTKVVVQEPPMIMKPATIYQALKRFPGVNCTYVLWEFTALTEGVMGVGNPPFQITVRGWGRLQPAKLGDGTAGALFHEASTTTLTILDPRSSPMTTETSEEPGAHREIGILTRLFASLYQQKQASMRQVIENLVLDATLAANRV